ncbi:MAG TPA: type II secretion system protein [Burkholderiaceae bacterium]|nr:type II secretion system protein [Burkholderiaceae bacterium]
MSTQSSAHRQHGISLIETLSVLSIVSVAIGTAIPGLGSLRQKAELHGAAGQIETNVQFAGPSRRAQPHRAAHVARSRRRHLLHGPHRPGGQLQL